MLSNFHSVFFKLSHCIVDFIDFENQATCLFRLKWSQDAVDQFWPTIGGQQFRTTQSRRLRVGKRPQQDLFNVFVLEETKNAFTVRLVFTELKQRLCGRVGKLNDQI